jgi:hypothetical protein
MGKKDAQIIQGLKNLHHQGHNDSSAILYGKVSAVNGIDTIDVDVDGVLYNDVQLQAIAKGDGKSLVIVPAKGSMVLIGNVENGTGYYMISANKVDKIVGSIGKTDVLIDTKGFKVVNGSCTLQQENNGFSIKVGAVSLGSALDDLCSAITKMTVTTGVGPSGPPINVADFTTVQTKLKTLLK